MKLLETSPNFHYLSVSQILQNHTLKQRLNAKKKIIKRMLLGEILKGVEE